MTKVEEREKGKECTPGSEVAVMRMRRAQLRTAAAPSSETTTSANSSPDPHSSPPLSPASFSELAARSTRAFSKRRTESSDCFRILFGDFSSCTLLVHSYLESSKDLDRF